MIHLCLYDHVKAIGTRGRELKPGIIRASKSGTGIAHLT